MKLLTKKVEAKIQDYLPETIAILIDGWSKGLVHFVCLFASFASDNANGYEWVMLVFAPILSETSFTARDNYEFVLWVLQLHGKNLDNVTAIIGDNVFTNKALADLCSKPLIGCASHRFNIAVRAFLVPYEGLIMKVNTLMGKLKNFKLAGKLRSFIELRAK